MTVQNSKLIFLHLQSTLVIADKVGTSSDKSVDKPERLLQFADE